VLPPGRDARLSDGWRIPSGLHASFPPPEQTCDQYRIPCAARNMVSPSAVRGGLGHRLFPGDGARRRAMSRLCDTVSVELRDGG